MKKKVSKSKKSVEEMIDDLAQMTARGFSDVHKKIDDGFENVTNEFKEVSEKFKEVSERLDRIEFSHVRRIEILEDKVRQIAIKVGLSK